MLNVYEELGETSRRQILLELRTGAKSVGELVVATNLKQPNVSNHLARMRSKGIVRDAKVGRQVYYSLATPEVEAVVHAVFSVNPTDSQPVDFGNLAKRFARAGVRGDEAECSEIMDEAFRAHLPIVDIYQELLAPAMQMVGQWFKVEAIDEAQEHMASAITERMMGRAMQITGPAKRTGKAVVLGCPPAAYHVIGLRMISDYLKMTGWRTLFLGANVPIKAFVAAIEQHNPELVLSSCNAEESAQSLLDLITEVNALRGRVKPFTFGVGGVAVNQNPDLFLKAGADFTADSLRSFAQRMHPSLERSAPVEPVLLNSSN